MVDGIIDEGENNFQTQTEIEPWVKIDLGASFSVGLVKVCIFIPYNFSSYLGH